VIERDLILILLAFNVIQFAGWSWHSHKLINKVMSRDFTEYKIAQRTHPPPTEKIDLDAASEDQEILNQLNGLIPR
jgi:hypothetical protein